MVELTAKQEDDMLEAGRERDYDDKLGADPTEEQYCPYCGDKMMWDDIANNYVCSNCE